MKSTRFREEISRSCLIFESLRSSSTCRNYAQNEGKCSRGIRFGTEGKDLFSDIEI